MATEDDQTPHVYLLGKTPIINEKREFHIRNDPIVYITAGDEHGIVITQRGRAFVFGANSFGQLGLGHTNRIERVVCNKSLKFNETDEKVILAACGVGSSLVATNYGSLYGFGSNLHCQLALPLTNAVQMYLEPKKITQLPSKIRWKQIAMGSEHVCALTETGQVYTWGANDEGQCGFDRKLHPIPTPQLLKLDFEVISIACGNYHTALIRRDGRLFLFGTNESRQCGRSIPPSHVGPTEVSIPGRVKSVACGHEHTLVLTEEGKVYVTGLGNRGQLGLGSKLQSIETFEHLDILPKHIIRIAAGEGHSAAIDALGYVYVFGDGKHGKLGFKSHSNEFKPRLLTDFTEMNVLNVVCGGCQTIVLAEKRVVADQDVSSADEDKDIRGTLTFDRLTMSLARTKRHDLLTTRTMQSDQVTLRHPTPRETADRAAPTSNRNLRIEPSSDAEADDLESNPDLTESMKSQLYNSRFGLVNGEFQTLDLNLQRDVLAKSGTQGKMLKTGALDQRAPLEKTIEQKKPSPPSLRPVVQRQEIHSDGSENSDEESDESEESPKPVQRIERIPSPSPRTRLTQAPRQPSTSGSTESESEEEEKPVRPRAQPPAESESESDDDNNQKKTVARISNSPQRPTQRPAQRPAESESDDDNNQKKPVARISHPPQRPAQRPAEPESDEENNQKKPVARISHPPQQSSSSESSSSEPSAPAPVRSTRPKTPPRAVVSRQGNQRSSRRPVANESSPGVSSRMFYSNPPSTNTSRKRRNKRNTTSQACSVM